ncbi:TPA: hypothetical protein ACH3X1_002843 [Trebouxia sp. C0004]
MVSFLVGKLCPSAKAAGPTNCGGSGQASGQTLIVLALLVSEVAYELVFHPARHRQVEYMQAAAIALLVYAAHTVLLLADYQNQAAQAGLAATGVIVGVANVLMCVLYLYSVARASRGKVREYIHICLHGGGVGVWQVPQKACAVCFICKDSVPGKRAVS